MRTFRFKKTGNYYEVIFWDVRSKDQYGDWLMSNVIYRPKYSLVEKIARMFTMRLNENVYSRTLDDFLSKFELA